RSGTFPYHPVRPAGGGAFNAAGGIAGQHHPTSGGGYGADSGALGNRALDAVWRLLGLDPEPGVCPNLSGAGAGYGATGDLSLPAPGAGLVLSGRRRLPGLSGLLARLSGADSGGGANRLYCRLLQTANQ